MGYAGCFLFAIPNMAVLTYDIRRVAMASSDSPSSCQIYWGNYESQKMLPLH